jgi:dihydroorotase
LHLTHLSCAAALDAVGRAKAAGLPVTCDVTPHHLALSDEWIAGARRWAWEAVGADDRPGDPWSDGALVAGPYDPALRVNPPLRTPADALACLAALADGTADAVATDHAPHTLVDKEVEFGLAANGISGLETALGMLLAAVSAGRLTLPRAIAALTTGPSGVLAGWPGVAARGDSAVGAASADRMRSAGGRRSAGRGSGPAGGMGAANQGPVVRPRGLVEGAPADLVVFDRADSWTVTAASLASKGKNSPLIGRELSGRVLLTIAGGRLAHEDRAAVEEG